MILPLESRFSCPLMSPRWLAMHLKPFLRYAVKFGDTFPKTYNLDAY